MNYDTHRDWVQSTARILDELTYLSDLELAQLYVDYMDQLEGDGFFIQEMQARGLTFEDLEQEIINYYDS